MKKFIVLTISIVMLAAFDSAAKAQISTGGNYAITQSVVATGGGQNSTGGAYSVDGTIGQAIAGQTASGSTYNVRAGFWSPDNFTPTAAAATVSGRVLTAKGNGIVNVYVSLTGADGIARTTRTTKFGYFRFNDVAPGQIYILTVAAKRFTFANPTQIISVVESLDDINFTAFEP